MNYKKKIAVMLPLLLITAITIYVNKFFTPLGTFIYLFSVVFFITFTINLFTRENVYKIWKSFSLFYFILATVLVVISPDLNGNIIGFDKESVSMWLAGLFLVISIGIIMWKSIQLRKNK